mmetsp:Transcript_29185/g.41624  ORF Transcript_29185/g.41624 Transcript_29185/m.41624 type:complete len:201 (+) Transcript_29185:332-934(+)
MCSVVAIGSIRCLAAWNLLSEKGLGRNSSKPIMMAVAAVSSSSRALMLIIASRLQRLPAAISSASNSRNLLAASKPSITGIWRSISTSDRSTEGSKSRFKAAAPFSAVSTRYPSFFRVMETILRMGIESSTTRMLWPCMFWRAVGVRELAMPVASGMKTSRAFCEQISFKLSGRYGILNQKRDPAVPSRRSLTPQSPLRE